MNKCFRTATAFVSAAALLQLALVTGTSAQTAPLVAIRQPTPMWRLICIRNPATG